MTIVGGTSRSGPSVSRACWPYRARRPGDILFVCTHNSARSQFAAALWRQRTGGAADSAGTHPGTQVHPRAVQVAGEWDLDLRDAVPKGYDALTSMPDLVVSVCDRARESDPVSGAPRLHWSVPDPVPDGSVAAFRAAFATIAERIDRLALASDRPVHPAHSQADAPRRLV